MSDIVKVQVPLATNDPRKLALVYAKGKKQAVQQPLDHGTKLALGDDVKAFFQADYRKATGTWLIGKRVKDRDW